MEKPHVYYGEKVNAKVEITEIDDSITVLIPKEHEIKCVLSDNKEVKLGVIAEIIDLREFDEQYDNDPYPFVIEFSLIPLEPSQKAIQETFKGYDINPKEVEKPYLIAEIYRYFGGVPFNIESIKANDEDKFLKEIDSEVRTRIQRLWGEIKVRYFRTIEDADKFIKKVAPLRLPALSVMIGFVLDRPLNLVGWTGWDIIEHIVNDKELSILV